MLAKIYIPKFFITALNYLPNFTWAHEYIFDDNLRVLGQFYERKVKVKPLSCVQFFVTSQIVAHQAPPSMGFSRQECWSGLPFPSPSDLPDPGIESRSAALQTDAFTVWATREARLYEKVGLKVLPASLAIIKTIVFISPMEWGTDQHMMHHCQYSQFATINLTDNKLKQRCILVSCLSQFLVQMNSESVKLPTVLWCYEFSTSLHSAGRHDLLEYWVCMMS